MNKKFIFLILILIVFIFSCTSSPKKETGLLGIWDTYELNSNKIVLTFYEDSVITESFGGYHRTSSDWTFDNSKLYLSNIKLRDTILADIEYEYIMNKMKDSLYIKVSPYNKESYTVNFKKVIINPFQLHQ